jgi:ATP-dependent DNA helicase PIF1
MTGTHEKIYQYRTQESSKRGIPPYCVFNNTVIDSLIIANPTSVGMLSTMKGWGVKTIANYGADVIFILTNPDSQIPPGISVDNLPKIEKPIPKQVEKKQDIILNKKQQIAYDALVAGKSVFLSGEAGTGKTEVVKKIRDDFAGKMNIALTSTTGTSALLMGGVTLHSYLGIGLGGGTANWLASIIMKKNYLMKRWLEIDILVIDEISMLNPELFDKLDKVGRIVRGSQSSKKAKEPWGGIQLLISGDFLQLPVVGCTKFTFEAESWNDSIGCSVILTENVRQQDDDAWKNILSEIRMGEISKSSEDILNTRVGASVGSNGIIPTKIFSHNSQVDKTNESSLDDLARENPELEFVEFNMSVIKLVSKKVDEDVINKMKERSQATIDLQLCVGAQVMLLINNMDLGLANGSRGIVTGFSEQGSPIVRFVNGVSIPIEPHDFNITDSSGNVIEFIIRQIPLKIAYAISIHKSQGITLDCAEVDIRNCFVEGQLYVAVSRVKSLAGLSIVGGFDPSLVVANEKCVDFYKN